MYIYIYIERERNINMSRRAGDPDRPLRDGPGRELRQPRAARGESADPPGIHTFICIYIYIYICIYRERYSVYIYIYIYV